MRGGPARETVGAMASSQRTARAFAGRTEESLAAGILGVIVSGAVMASAHADSVLQLFVAVLATLFVYWAAERYARVVSRRIAEARRPTWSELRRELTDGWEIVTESTLPLLVLAVLGLLGAEYRTAVLSALATNTALLVLAGWSVGSGGRLSTAERLISAAVAGFFGLLAIAFKTFVH
jgi:hypothetical protein